MLTHSTATVSIPAQQSAKRRLATLGWFQISLKTLLLAVTALAVWLGLETKVVHERRAFLKTLPDALGSGPRGASFKNVDHLYIHYDGDRIPFWRRWLGDRGVEAMHLPHASADLLDAGQRLFPEAEVRSVLFSVHECGPGSRTTRLQTAGHGSSLTLKKIDWFFEFPSVRYYDLLRSRVCEIPHDQQEEIVRYLESGTACAVVPGLEVDLLSPAEDLIGPVLLRTDGTRVWPESLAYYVRHYNLELAAKFVETMSTNEWRCPDVGLPALE